MAVVGPRGDIMAGGLELKSASHHTHTRPGFLCVDSRVYVHLYIAKIFPKKKKKKKAAAVSEHPGPEPRGITSSRAAATAGGLQLLSPLWRVNCALGGIMGKPVSWGEIGIPPTIPPNIRTRKLKG
eukprot:FR736704.1.p1 GENE.FR736704.1~~FR736704.1.p1  ORF type:complete len:126 (+),score=33.63 FR736704.1:619-996(+)